MARMKVRDVATCSPIFACTIINDEGVDDGVKIGEYASSHNTIPGVVKLPKYIIEIEVAGEIVVNSWDSWNWCVNR